MPVAAAALAGPSQNDATPAATPAARKVLPVRQPSASAQVSAALAAASVRPQAIHQPDMAAAKITATGNIDRMPCACMVALAMSTKKPTAEMAEPIWGARPAAAPIAIAARWFRGRRGCGAWIRSGGRTRGTHGGRCPRP